MLYFRDIFYHINNVVFTFTDKPKVDQRFNRFQLLKGICEGLHFLHEIGINHLDLKPDNVLLDANMEPKITDFGLSRFINDKVTTIVTKNTPGTL
ncbi:hypothetical protein PR202_ga03754 [Eleusine coracana subsp. coracana]|uniref:Protein kinase domain-containing protein n=1 Tax=Eleusine coracana subsp. coracana TaxID=191504 RepID=A0AAV5BMY5_ELECO|nr:hypothetical protein PR202_ga03754 [Eleusine coracana subsp. coracana]